MDGFSSVLQLGFSLATTLNSYLANVRHGRDDIANLANEIDATVIHVQELGKLIDVNDETGGWNENGLKIARKCCTDCEVVLKSLRRTLGKSGAEIPASEVVKRDEINLGLFDRFTWPWLKPKLAASKQELQAVKIDILIARNTYKANVGFPPSEREAAAQRIIPLWKSKNALEQQMIVTRERPTTTAPPPIPPRVVLNDPIRPRSRSRVRSRERVRTRARDSNLDSSISPRRRTRRRRSRSSSTEPTRRKAPRRKEKPRGDAVSIPSASPKADTDNTGNIENAASPAPKLTGHEVDSPREEKNTVSRQISKSLKQSSSSHSDIIQNLIQSYPAQAKRLGISPKILQNQQHGIPHLLQDPKLKGGIAIFRAISLIKMNDKEFHPHQIDYPFAMLAKQLLHEEKSQKSGEAFALRAWQNFPTLPPWCKEYIEEFLARGDEKDHFWTLLIADPVYNKAEDSWKAKFFGKRRSRNEENLTSVLVVFKHCTKETIRKETGPENMFDPLLEKLSGPVDELMALIKESWSEKRERNRREIEESGRGRRRRRSRSPSRSPSRSRSEGRYDDRPSTASATETPEGRGASRSRSSRRYDPDLGTVQYGTEPIYAAQDEEVSIHSDQSSGIEPVNLPDTEEGLMEKIMVLYTGLPPSYSDDEGYRDNREEYRWTRVAEDIVEGEEMDQPDLEAQWPFVEEVE